MSKKEPKQRVVVFQAGHDRELLSMKEGPKGDVYIFVKRTDEMRFGGKQGTLKEERFTVHPSSKTEGYTITSRITFDDGAEAEGYTHAKPAEGGFCWPITARTCPLLDFERYIAKPGQDDTVLHLEKFDPELSVLGWMLVATDANTDISDQLAAGHYRFVSFRFQLFSLWLIHGYLHIPSDLVGMTLLGVTHPPRLDRVEVEPPEEMSGNSPEPRTALAVVDRMMMQLAAAHVDEVQKTHRLREEIHQHLRRQTARWWAQPRG